MGLWWSRLFSPYGAMEINPEKCYQDEHFWCRLATIYMLQSALHAGIIGVLDEF